MIRPAPTPPLDLASARARFRKELGIAGKEPDRCVSCNALEGLTWVPILLCPPCVEEVRRAEPSNVTGSSSRST